MKKLIYLYLFIIMLITEIYFTVNTYSETITNVKIRILTINDKPYGNTHVTIAYNTYHLSNPCREYCSANITDIEGYVEFTNVTAQQCTTGYCVAIKISIPIYNLEFILRNVRVNPPNTFLTIKLPFIDIRDRNISIVDEYGNPLNGVFNIYYGNTLIHQVIFINGIVSLHDSLYPLLSFIGKNEVMIEYAEGVKDSKSISLFKELEYTLEIDIEGLKTPYIRRIKSSELIRLSKIIVKTNKGVQTETSENTGIYPSVSFSETIDSTGRSWFNPSSGSDEEQGINKVFLLGPLISIVILFYESLIKKRRGG